MRGPVTVFQGTRMACATRAILLSAENHVRL